MLANLLKGKKVVLASASPRRKEIFKNIGMKPLYIPANIDEVMFDLPPYKLVMKHSLSKAKEVAQHLDQKCIVIGADTIVYLDGKILGKPGSKYQAFDYLEKLSGKKHTVYTGVTICYKKQVCSFFEKTIVEFDELSQFDIENYVDTGESFDKAGAYAIQGFGSQFIKKITGCYFNVMGFPINRFNREIKKILRKDGEL
ncbi:MAG: Maf family protein [Candidatus Cloacimonadales bacterium]